MLTDDQLLTIIESKEFHSSKDVNIENIIEERKKTLQNESNKISSSSASTSRIDNKIDKKVKLDLKRPLRPQELEELLYIDSEDGLDESDVDSTYDPEEEVSTNSENEEEIDDQVINEPSTNLLNNKAQGKHKIKNKTRSAKNKVQSLVWVKDADNPLGNNIPQSPPHYVKMKKQSPFEYFSVYFSDEFLRDIVYQTNLYAFQNNKHNFSLTLPELKIYRGIILIMSYIKYPRVRQYWSSKNGGIRVSIIANAMSLNRFEEIRRFLHFVDISNLDERTNDKLFRIRPVLDHLHKVYHEAVSPEEYMSIDEMMIPFKWRSSLKKLLTKKNRNGVTRFGPVQVSLGIYIALKYIKVILEIKNFNLT